MPRCSGGGHVALVLRLIVMSRVYQREQTKPFRKHLCTGGDEQGRAWLGPCFAVVLTVSFVISSWFVRNYLTFHKVIPFRSCLGLELYCGKNADAWHWGPPEYHPSNNAEAWREYLR